MKIKRLKLFCLALVLYLVVGCATTGTKVRYGDSGAVERLTADFGSTDLHMIVKEMVNSMVSSPVTVWKRTLRPWAQAANAMALAKWVLPVPEFPIKRMFSLLSMYSPLISSLTSC